MTMRFALLADLPPLILLMALASCGGDAGTEEVNVSQDMVTLPAEALMEPQTVFSCSVKADIEVDLVQEEILILEDKWRFAESRALLDLDVTDVTDLSACDEIQKLADLIAVKHSGDSEFWSRNQFLHDRTAKTLN